MRTCAHTNTCGVRGLWFASRPARIRRRLAPLNGQGHGPRHQDGQADQRPDAHALALVREALNQAEHTLVEAGQTPTHHTSKN